MLVQFQSFKCLVFVLVGNPLFASACTDLALALCLYGFQNKLFRVVFICMYLEILSGLYLGVAPILYCTVWPRTNDPYRESVTNVFFDAFYISLVQYRGTGWECLCSILCAQKVFWRVHIGPQDDLWLCVHFKISIFGCIFENAIPNFVQIWVQVCFLGGTSSGLVCGFLVLRIVELV